MRYTVPRVSSAEEDVGYHRQSIIELAKLRRGKLMVKQMALIKIKYINYFITETGQILTKGTVVIMGWYAVMFHFSFRDIETQTHRNN